MPFKSKKQKKTIDAAAHNPAFAKKVGIDVSAAKKMSKHGKGQTKFEEAKDTVEKDEKGNVKSWKHEGDWVKSKGKEGRGKVTNLSDKARRETEKLSKAEKEMAESFEKAISEVKITSGPNKGKEWSQKTMGPTNPAFKNKAPDPRFYDPDGESAPPSKPAKSMKKAEVDPATTTTDVEEPAVAEGKQTYGGKGKKKTKSEHDAEVKQDKEKKKFKKMMEAFVQIGRLEQMISEAKKSKCTCSTNEDTCKVHGKMEEGNDGNLANNAKPYDKVTRGDVIAGRLGKDEMGGKKKSKKVSEASKEKEPEGLYSKKRFETDSQRVARLAKEKRQAEKKKAEEKTNEGNDGNLANNAKPYDKVTRGDVIAGRLGKDEMGGKKKDEKVKENYTINGKKVSKAAYEKEMAKAGKGKKKVKEGWTHDSLAAQLFETDEYMMTLHESLQKKLKG